MPILARTGTRARVLALGASIAIVVAGVALTRSALDTAAECTVINEGEPSSLDPHQGTGVVEGRVMRFLYEGLVVRDPRTLEPLPGAAERWETSATGLRWTFHLHANGRWSDGAPLRATDFVYAWRRLLDARTGASYGPLLHVVRGARAFTEGKAPFESVGLAAPDERTLVVELEHPVERFLDLAAFYPLAPLPAHQLERLKAVHGNRWELAWSRPENLVVNGPFVLVERRIRDRLRFAKNAAYWDASSVAMNTIDVLAVEHPGTMLNLYLTGAADWTGNFPQLLVPEVRARADYSTGPQIGTAFYRFNVTRPPLDDRRVRTALALAIDRRELVERVTRAGEVAQWSFVPACARGGKPAEVAEGGVPALNMRERNPAALDHDGARPGNAREGTPAELAHGPDFASDVARARALLAEAGYGPGGKLLPPIEIAFNTQSNNKDVAEVIADGWRRHLGVQTLLANMEWKIFLDAQRSLDYQISRSSWVADQPDPLGMLEIFRSGSANNRTGWSSAEYDALLDAAARARGAEREQSLVRAEAILLSELPIAPLYGYVTKNLVDPHLGGFHDNPLDEHAPKYWYWK